MLCRLYTSAMEDLKEALKLAPTNRELQRLLVRVRDECMEQAQNGGQDSEENKRSNETAL